MATNLIAPIPADTSNPYGSSVTPPTPPGQVANLATSQTPSGTGTSTHIVDRGDARGPAVLKIVSTIGATPSVTVAVEGSLDGSDWFTLAHGADDAATPATATFAITTATTTRRFLPANRPWRFLRLAYSAALNVTVTADLLM